MSHPKQARRRTAGRPNLGSGVGRERIIEAARDLLRSHSPEELTVVEIAAAAEVDPALVRYYFGTKKGIFHATANAMLEQVQARTAQVLAEQGPLRQRIRSRLELLISLHEENPRFLELVIKEIYGSDPEPGEEPQDLAAIARRGLALTQTLVGDSHAADPRFLHVAILGLSTFFVDARPMLKVLFGPQADAASIREGYIETLTEVLARGLEGRAD